MCCRRFRRRQWYPTPVLLLGKSHGWRSLEGCSPWVAKSQTGLSDFTFTFHFHALEKEMATHSSVLAWRIPGAGEPGGLPSMGSHRVGHGNSVRLYFLGSKITTDGDCSHEIKRRLLLGRKAMTNLLLLSRISRVRLCATPETAAHQAPPSLGFSRQEQWSGLPFLFPMHESEK